MSKQKVVEPTPPGDVERTRAPKSQRHWLETNPPPPLCAMTVDQVEKLHPGLAGRLRQWIVRADAGDPEFAWLRLCTIRLARSVLIDETKLRDQLHQHTAIAPAPARNTGGRGNANPTRRATAKELA